MTVIAGRHGITENLRHNMEIYLVGGAVRDRLMDIPVQERDWVVVGSTRDEMLAKGFRQVGKDFPVFLHPDTGEEYALARTERKSGHGYHGFEMFADPGVTLEEDLKRRDLTINAIAQAADGRIIDPFGGEQDIREGRLRHVSPAFAEDPVRILRIARFAARLGKWGFHVAHDTNALMRRMVENGEVDHLVPERVWKELSRALGEPEPDRFFHVLRGCGALQKLFPELDRLFGVEQPAKHHPEIDCGVHVMMVLQQAARLSPEPRVRFAALVHDLGKGTTPEHILPRHIGHEARSAELVNTMCDRFKAPNDYRDLAVKVAKYHSHCHRIRELKPATVLKTLEALDAFRRRGCFDEFLLACEADARGRTGHEEDAYPQAGLFRDMYTAAAAVTARPFVEQGLTGEAIANAMRKARINAIESSRTGQP